MNEGFKAYRWGRHVLKSRARVLVAARVACIRRGVGLDWHHDLAQEVALMQMRGDLVRLDRIGMDWILNRILDNWTGARLTEETRRFGFRTVEPVSPITFVLLHEIHNAATKAQREAMFTLMERGPIKWGLPRKQTVRHSNALRALRENLGVRPVMVTRHDRWKKRGEKEKA
jgi:hypothetical protein